MKTMMMTKTTKTTKKTTPLLRNYGVIQKRCLDQATAEEQVYARLEPLQKANKAPKYYSAVDLAVNPSPSARTDNLTTSFPLVQDYLRIPGCLISFVDGFLLSDLETHVAPADWKKAIAAATAVVNEIGDYSVLNGDVSPTNIFIQKYRADAAYDAEYRAVVFDFAQARLRRSDESDQEWREHK